VVTRAVLSSSLAPVGVLILIRDRPARTILARRPDPEDARDRRLEPGDGTSTRSRSLLRERCLEFGHRLRRQRAASDRAPSGHASDDRIYQLESSPHFTGTGWFATLRGSRGRRWRVCRRDPARTGRPADVGRHDPVVAVIRLAPEQVEQRTSAWPPLVAPTSPGLSGVACLRSTGWGGTVSCVASRPVIDLDVTVDGRSTASETTYTWAGAHILTVHTVIPRADLALELHSTFVGHSGVSMHVVHLTLGPPGREPTIASADHDEDELDPTYAPRACAYEHAQHMIEVLAGLGYRAAVDVPGERAFDGLERVTRPA
jgi:hypothetical protein